MHHTPYTVSCAVCRNRFREILLNLHLDYNTNITEDRYYIVRVLFEKLYFNFKQYGSFVSHSADESIIPYCRRDSAKQFIRGKPVSFGFKLWSITSTEGYLFHADPYCRLDTDFSDTGLGQGVDVGLCLIEKCKVKAESTVTFGNLLTLMPLLDQLTESEISALGTLR